jgi:hypothetical protein
VRKVEAGRKVIMPRHAMHFSSSPWPMLCGTHLCSRLGDRRGRAGRADRSRLRGLRKDDAHTSVRNDTQQVSKK